MRTEPGDYVTDETALFMVVRPFHCAGERYAELEDCRTLDLLLSRSADLEQLSLRLVRPSGGAQLGTAEPALA